MNQATEVEEQVGGGGGHSVTCNVSLIKAKRKDKENAFQHQECRKNWAWCMHQVARRHQVAEGKGRSRSEVAGSDGKADELGCKTERGLILSSFLAIYATILKLTAPRVKFRVSALGKRECQPQPKAANATSVFPLGQVS